MDRRKCVADAVAVINDAIDDGYLIDGREVASILGVKSPSVTRLSNQGFIDVASANSRVLYVKQSVMDYKSHRDSRSRAGSYESCNEPKRYING